MGIFVGATEGAADSEGEGSDEGWADIDGLKLGLVDGSADSCTDDNISVSLTMISNIGEGQDKIISLCVH